MTKKEELLIVLRDVKLELYTIERILKMKENKIKETKDDLKAWEEFYKTKLSFYYSLLGDLKKEKGE